MLGETKTKRRPTNAARVRNGTLLLSTILLIGCAAITGRNLQKEYLEMITAQGLTPVYPPREELQVGDIFIRSYVKGAETDLDGRISLWVAHLDELRRGANLYMQSRITFDDTEVKPAAGNVPAHVAIGQDDFENGSVSVNSASRTRLPVVSFPVITGSASTAGALGGFEFLSSFGFGIGSSEQVSLDLTDTRAHGMPSGAIQAQSRYLSELQDTVCHTSRTWNGSGYTDQPLIQTSLTQLRAIARQNGIELETMCSGDRTCDVAIVTRTYVTRQLNFNYSSARIARLAAAERRGPLPETPTTQTLPTNLTVNATLSDAAQAESLIAGLSAAVGSGGGTAETSALTFLGFQANTLAFSRIYPAPIAVGYESWNFKLADIFGLCPAR